MWRATSVKYPNNTQLINWSSLFLWNFDLRIINWITISDALKRNVVIPMSIFVINAREYDMELIGVVPRRDTIEKATPIAIKNNPQTKANILFIILSLHFL